MTPDEPILLGVLALASFVLSVVLSGGLVRLGHRLGTFDSAGVSGQVKAPPRRVPNTGGVGVFWAMAGPLLALVIAAGGSGLGGLEGWGRALVGPDATAAVALLVGLGVLHGVGLVDDRRPLGPWPKLLVMLGVALGVAWVSGTRLLMLLDPYVGGAWLSLAITVVWFVVVTNAMNFLDNMDGLAGGVGATAAACFLVTAASSGQWFVAGVLALLVGALGGFLVFNAPPARIFMGDGGSLVLGFSLAFLTARTTYYQEGQAGAWYGVLMPLVVLAIPLYDFTSVTLLRLSQGRSPFVGDLQHFSHRLVERGLSRRSAVLVIVALTGVTGIGGVTLSDLPAWRAALVGGQTLLVLGVLGLLEWKSGSLRRGSAA